MGGYEMYRVEDAYTNMHEYLNITVFVHMQYLLSVPWWLEFFSDQTQWEFIFSALFLGFQVYELLCRFFLNWSIVDL